MRHLQKNCSSTVVLACGNGFFPRRYKHLYSKFKQTIFLNLSKFFFQSLEVLHKCPDEYQCSTGRHHSSNGEIYFCLLGDFFTPREEGHASSSHC